MVVADLLAGVSYIGGRLGHSGTNHVNTPTGLGQREMKTTSLVFGAGLKMPWGEAGQVFGGDCSISARSQGIRRPSGEGTEAGESTRLWSRW